MTTPIGPTVVDLEEMEQMSQSGQAPKPVDLSTVKLEGDSVPDDLKGKTAAELIDYNKRLQDALRISELGRQTAAPAPVAAPAAPAPVAEPEMDPEELRRMFQEDPVGAFEKLQDKWAKKAEEHLSARLQPLVSGAASAAEGIARSKYPEEFALFEKDIKAIVDGMPAHQRSALSNPAAWDDLVGFVRGKSGNFERFIQAKTEKTLKESRRTVAQESQELETGLSFSDARRAPPASATGMAPDATTQHICDVLGISYAEYSKWSKVR